MKPPYSSHIFIFPFQWENSGDPLELFGERYHLHTIHKNQSTKWKRVISPSDSGEMAVRYNEHQYFFDFVHNALYDTGPEPHPVIDHFERVENGSQSLSYEIGFRENGKEKNFVLTVDNIHLNIYFTGVGLLIFYVSNNSYPDIEDINLINHYGSRVFPGYVTDNNELSGLNGQSLPLYLAITGLSGDADRYREDFSQFSKSSRGETARFLTSLIVDFDPTISIKARVDQRMFVLCWVFNEGLSQTIKEQESFNKYMESADWFRLLHIDGNECSCRNPEMRKYILIKQTYTRWQEKGLLYGITPNSFVVISDAGEESEQKFLSHFRAMYARMAELVLLQRVSILNFSGEVTRISNLAIEDATRMGEIIDDLYMSYIRFVNQCFFIEVTPRQEGTDLYKLYLETLEIQPQIDDLNKEIDDLHQYGQMLGEKLQGRHIKLLTILGSLFLLPTFITGFYGMNLFPDALKDRFWLLIAVSALLLAIAGGLWGIMALVKPKHKNITRILIGITIAIVLVLMGLGVGYSYKEFF